MAFIATKDIFKYIYVILESNTISNLVDDINYGKAAQYYMY